jgi:hypothetical protein
MLDGSLSSAWLYALPKFMALREYYTGFLSLCDRTDPTDGIMRTNFFMCYPIFIEVDAVTGRRLC